MARFRFHTHSSPNCTVQEDGISWPRLGDIPIPEARVHLGQSPSRYVNCEQGLFPPKSVFLPENWRYVHMCLIFCLRKASRDVPQFRTVLRPDEPIIHGKYRKSKMHFIHFTYLTPSPSVAVLKCSQNTRSTTGWQHSVSCDRGAAWELLPTARCRCPGSGGSFVLHISSPGKGQN